VTRRIALGLLIVLILVLDQGTKHLARTRLAHEAPRTYGGFVTLLYAENRGAFLSMGSDLPGGVRAFVFDGLVMVGLACAAIVLFRSRMRRRSDEIALALIVAGGAGNLIDRLRHGGRVTDFLYLSAGSLHTGVFNVADMAVTFGVIVLLISWRTPSRPADSPSRPSR
jgi:signal peptidase II